MENIQSRKPVGRADEYTIIARAAFKQIRESIITRIFAIEPVAKHAERFHFSDNHLKGVELLDAVCSGRGWLLKGGQYDYDRCCSVVLDEFRAGKLGRITLEDPPKKPEGEMDND